MSDTVIRVENLGKKYIISHQQQGRSRYTALRDVLADSAKSLGRRILNPFAQQPSSPTREEFWALKDVSFEIKQGDRVGIIGRNGAGKSTLLKLLSRITEPTTGRISVKGRVASLLEVGTGFHPELTGRENIYLNGTILGMSRIEVQKKFDEIITFAEIEKFLDTPVKHYSSGMYVRLAFAVAAHLEVDTLIVDEVLAVGDTEFQKKCLGRMERISQKEGRTVLFVSHNMGAISLLCNQAIYLANNSLKSIGESSQIITEYLSQANSWDEFHDLSKIRAPGFGERIRFLDIKLLPEGCTSLKANQPIEFLLVIQSDKDFKDLSIGSSVFTSSGHCIGSLISDSFSVGCGEVLELHLIISGVGLAPALYYIGFSIGSGGKTSAREDFDVVVGKPTFQIAPILYPHNTPFDWNPNWGNLIIQNTTLRTSKNKQCNYRLR